jgi:hypothetical protein
MAKESSGAHNRSMHHGPPRGLSASNGPGLLPFCLGNCIPHVGVAKILIMEMLYGNAGDAEFQHLLGDFRAESRSQLVVVS